MHKKIERNESYYQTITADGIASLRKVEIFRKASIENPAQVLVHEGENLTYNTNRKTLIQLEIAFAKAAPLNPRLDLKTMTQHIRMCSKVVTAEHIIIGNTMFWVCKNLTRHWRRPYANRLGTKKQAYSPALSEMSWSWPRNSRIGPVFSHIIARGMLTITRISMALCMCMPIIEYCFAPYDCPQRVSRAVAIPNFAKQQHKINSHNFRWEYILNCTSLPCTYKVRDCPIFHFFFLRTPHTFATRTDIYTIIRPVKLCIEIGII